jgi:hypothetical protein
LIAITEIFSSILEKSEHVIEKSHRIGYFKATDDDIIYESIHRCLLWYDKQNNEAQKTFYPRPAITTTTANINNNNSKGKSKNKQTKLI